LVPVFGKVPVAPSPGPPPVMGNSGASVVVPPVMGSNGADVVVVVVDDGVVAFVVADVSAVVDDGVVAFVVADVAAVVDDGVVLADGVVEVVVSDGVVDVVVPGGVVDVVVFDGVVDVVVFDGVVDVMVPGGVVDEMVPGGVVDVMVPGGVVDVMVPGGVVDVVVCVGAVHLERVMVLVSRVTAPFRASSLPLIVAPVWAVIEARARTVPTNLEPTPIVAELPTCQKTLHACAPLIRATLLFVFMMSVLADWKMNTAFESPCALSVTVPFTLSPRVSPWYRPGTSVSPARSAGSTVAGFRPAASS